VKASRVFHGIQGRARAVRRSSHSMRWLALAVLGLWNLADAEPADSTPEAAAYATGASSDAVRAPAALTVAATPAPAASEAEPPNTLVSGSEANAAEARAARTAIHQGRLSSPTDGLEDRVRLLAKRFDLDAGQQVRLREILENLRRETRKVWGDTAGYGSDRVTPTRAVLDRTRDEIRAMLNEEQRRNYPAPVPREGLAPAHADVAHWIELTQPASPQRAGPAN
jgi:hypothetical protein